jgi:hypothetical protein
LSPPRLCKGIRKEVSASGTEATKYTVPMFCTEARTVGLLVLLHKSFAY